MRLLQISPINDFSCVGVIANHCDNNKICIAENEAINFDVSNLFCECWNSVLLIWEEVDSYLAAAAACESDPDCNTPPVPPENYSLKYQLIYGGSYLSCKDNVMTSEGVKKCLIYYTYSRYLLINSINDTATGMNYKNNDFATNIPIKDLESIADKYRNMGYSTFKRVRAFLCYHKLIECFKCKECKCGDSSCSGGTENKGFGFRSRIIER